MPILKMLTSLCGSEFNLAPGDEHEFEEREAASLIRAGFAAATDGFVPPNEPEEGGEQRAAEAAAAETAPAEVAPAADAAAEAAPAEAEAPEASAKKPAKKA